MQLLETYQEVVLFDGVCNLCSASVNFILKWEKNSKLKFASLQSPDGLVITAEAHKQGAKMESILFVKKGKILNRSTAVLHICRYLKFPLSLCMLFSLVPRGLRDFIYNIIAKNRYRWFGKQNECMLPQPIHKNRFLD